MDATSANGTGFDAALKALEDLETSTVPVLDDKPAARPAPDALAVSMVALAEVVPEDEPAAITAVPIDEIDFEIPEFDDLPPVAPVAAPVVAPAPVIVASAAPPSRMVKVAVGLGLFSSLLSATGLIVAERTIMSAQLVVADARERQQQLELANKLIRDLETLRAKQIELLQQQQAQVASGPVTSAELQHRMETLQEGILARDPLNQVVEAIHTGQADSTQRLNEFSMKLARVERALDGH